MLLGYLDTAKLAIFPGLRLRLRLDEAFELRERLLIFHAHHRFKVQRSRPVLNEVKDLFPWNQKILRKLRMRELRTVNLEH